MTLIPYSISIGITTIPRYIKQSISDLITLAHQLHIYLPVLANSDGVINAINNQLAIITIYACYMTCQIHILCKHAISLHVYTVHHKVLKVSKLHADVLNAILPCSHITQKPRVLGCAILRRLTFFIRRIAKTYKAHVFLRLHLISATKGKLEYRIIIIACCLYYSEITSLKACKCVVSFIIIRSLCIIISFCIMPDTEAEVI